MLLRECFALMGWLIISVSTVHAQFARQEVLPIPIEDMSQVDFLNGQKENGKPRTIAGILRLPKVGEKLPVVVLMHGAGGVGPSNNTIDAWTSVLNAAGYATYVVDSFGGRGVYSAAEVNKVPPITRVIDGYRALQSIAAHPSIDATRSVLMGFSHGSQAALHGNTDRFSKRYAAPDLQYAGFISVYGICTTTIRGDQDTLKPMLMLHGLADDWLPASKCREHAEKLQKAGKPVKLIEYPDAHHAFDAPNLAKEVKLPQMMSVVDCSFAEEENGVIINAVSKQRASPADPCLMKGTTIGYNEAATAKAHVDVKEFLAEILARK